MITIDGRISVDYGGSTSGLEIMKFTAKSCITSRPLTASSPTFSRLTNKANEITNNSTFLQVGAMTTNAITINSTCNINSSLTTASCVFFNGISQQSGSLPTGNSTNAGLAIHWNTTSGKGRTTFLIMHKMEMVDLISVE